jgi:hypothetical protein
VRLPGLQQLVEWSNCKKIGFALASSLFPGISKIGFGFRLALTGLRVPIESFTLLLRRAIPRVENKLIGLSIFIVKTA